MLNIKLEKRIRERTGTTIHGRGRSITMVLLRRLARIRKCTNIRNEVRKVKRRGQCNARARPLGNQTFLFASAAGSVAECSCAATIVFELVEPAAVHPWTGPVAAAAAAAAEDDGPSWMKWAEPRRINTPVGQRKPLLFVVKFVIDL